jgi:hypothetical protein
MNPTPFASSLIARDAMHVNRLTDACNWYAGDVEVFLERAHFPWSPFKPMSVEYWPNVVYASLALAEREAVQYGGKVTECFYADPDNMTWFLRFDDFDKVAAYAEHYLKNPVTL